MSHLGDYRHLNNKRMFTPVFRDEEQQQQQQQPRELDSNEWPPPKSRHSRPEPFDNGGLPQPHKRIRPGDEKVEEPWKFSPSEINPERYNQVHIFSKKFFLQLSKIVD